MGKVTRKSMKAHADKLFSLFVRASAGNKCRRCLSTDRVQCAHIFSRRYLNTRWDPANSMALCAHCHLFYTHRPEEWRAYCEEWLTPDGYEALRRKAMDTDAAKKIDLPMVIAALKDALKETDG